MLSISSLKKIKPFLITIFVRLNTSETSSLLGAVVSVSARTAGGDRTRQQAGAHIPQRPVDQNPRPAAQRGRATDPEDYPSEITAYTMRTPDKIKHSAAEHGPAVAEFAGRLFDGPLPWARIRQGHKLIRLGQRYTPERLDAACRRALNVDLIDVRRVERILVQALEQDAIPYLPEPLPHGRFARPGSVFAHSDEYRRRTA